MRRKPRACRGQLVRCAAQARRGIVFGAAQFLGKLQPKNVEPVARRAQREPQRSRRLALAVACIDLNLADLQ